MLKPSHLILGCTLWLSACSSVPNVVEPPKISVQNVSLQNLSLTEGTGLVSLSVTNPNAFPIPLQGIQYNLRLNGTPVASGDQRQDMNLVPNQPVTVQVPVKLQLAELVRIAPMLWREKHVQYQLNGAVRFPFISVPFQREGGVGVGQ